MGRSEGRLIVFEGPDGCGKTTQLALAEERLRRAGYKVVTVREPGGTRLGERVRTLLLDPACGEISARAELMLFMAARAQLVEEVLRPELAGGAAVLSDRFLASSMAYQGYGGGLPPEDVRLVGRVAVGRLEPDLEIIIDVPVEIGMERIGAKGDRGDRMERKDAEYHRRVREGYLALGRSNPRARLIDGRLSIRQVHERAMEEIEGALR